MSEATRVLRELEAQRAGLRKAGRATVTSGQPGAPSADVLIAKSRGTLALREQVLPQHKAARLLMAQSAGRDAARALRLLGEDVTQQPAVIFQKAARR